QPGPINALSNLLGGVWACLLAWLLQRLPAGRYLEADASSAMTRILAVVSLFYPAFYMIASWPISIRHPRRPLAFACGRGTDRGAEWRSAAIPSKRAPSVTAASGGASMITLPSTERRTWSWPKSRRTSSTGGKDGRLGAGEDGAWPSLPPSISEVRAASEASLT